MMIIWTGKNCSDCCPFYSVDLEAKGKKVRFHNPRCGVSGHKDIGTDQVFDIRLELKGSGKDAYCPKGPGCPFLDVHGLSLEVQNNAE